MVAVWDGAVWGGAVVATGQVASFASLPLPGSWERGATLSSLCTRCALCAVVYCLRWEVCSVCVQYLRVVDLWCVVRVLHACLRVRGLGTA